MSKNNIDITQLLQLAAAQQQQNSQHKGVTYLQLMSIALLVLKCTGFISCAWFWVFFPVMIPWFFYTFILVVGFLKAKFFKG